MKKFALIVAGGIGIRMKADIPKQFLLLAGEPILMHTIRAFFQATLDIIAVVVLPSNQSDHWRKLCEEYSFTYPHKVTRGGKTRFQSVKNGLAMISGEGLIAVHDGIRPLVDSQIIINVFEVAEKQGNAIPAIGVTESVRITSNHTNRAADRKQFRLVQTPQVFHSSVLQNAYRQVYREEFTDDATVVEASGHRIHLIEGDPNNIKITTATDLQLAEVLIRDSKKHLFL
ncbi:MAG: 2-C-methyl-D-erythritol 4-phosphate cytidylyltransferase [Bacteroidales bacterium]|nr:2-C-methyl-D-erythritol 4-phosphate cytidylyltransferase [Bacteroidales bacterium]